MKHGHIHVHFQRKHQLVSALLVAAEQPERAILLPQEVPLEAGEVALVAPSAKGCALDGYDGEVDVRGEACGG